MELELEDVGRPIVLNFEGRFRNNYSAEVTPIMVIKAPRGTLTIFEGKFMPHSRFSFPLRAKKCQAIRAFMREHKHD